MKKKGQNQNNVKELEKYVQGYFTTSDKQVRNDYFNKIQDIAKTEKKSDINQIIKDIYNQELNNVDNLIEHNRILINQNGYIDFECNEVSKAAVSSIIMGNQQQQDINKSYYYINKMVDDISLIGMNEYSQTDV
jgi:hypothetical protein